MSLNTGEQLDPSEVAATDKKQVLLIDDEESMRISGEQCLMLGGFTVETCENAEQALMHLTPEYPGVIVTDIKMPRMDGLELMQRIRQLDAEIPVILLTGHGDIDMAVQAMRDGAYDFQQKPFHPDNLVRMVERAQEQRQLVLENRRLRCALKGDRLAEKLLMGHSPQMQALRDSVIDLANLPVNVLIHGETGSGKEQVAKCLHRLSRRSEAKLVAINCAAMPEHLFESEIFGFEPGAFTGADRQRVGKLEYADGGTLFLDEIETMPLSLQVKLLRVLQDRQIERLGSNQLIDLDFRVLSATKTDLMAASAAGEFREDLYYRLNVAEIQIPPLRERREDIPLLFDAFVRDAAHTYERETFEVDREDIHNLLLHSWPGNVRELKNIAERFVLGRAGRKLPVAELLKLDGDSDSPRTFQEQMQAFERSLLEQALRSHKGQVQPILDELGLPRRTFNEALNKHGLIRKEFVDLGK